MDAPNSRPSTSLFNVYLRLRPSITVGAERFLDVERLEDSEPKHITIKPPASDHRKRAVEKFAFTRVFEEDASQLDLFRGTGVVPLVEGVLGAEGQGRDALLATLGVTGSGKSHTILGSKAQRGLTQMALDVLFQSISHNIVHPSCTTSVFPSLAASDVSEAQMLPAAVFLESLYGEGYSTQGSFSRAQTPMMDASFSYLQSYSKQRMPRTSLLPQVPSIAGLEVPVDKSAEYALVISMYEVYNDRIFDLLGGLGAPPKIGTPKRRPLLFKSTETSPDRKVVAGLRKVVCCSMDEALLVLETGLLERRVAGTGSNAVSSRSHGFFCVEVKKRNRIEKGSWISSTLTIVDLAGSERARQAKTAGATLAEAGKINESLMYLGQCMQMQSDNQDGNKNIVPFRQCKLTELLFSNSFPSSHASIYQQHNHSHHNQNQQQQQQQQQQLHHHHNHHNHSHRNPQKSVMIVTADPTGDFNATSQILRYSALAREVTVPRVPSVTSTILAGQIYNSSSSSGGSGGSSGSSNGSNSNNQNLHNLRSGGTAAGMTDEVEQAQRELIQQMADEIEVLALRLAEERSRREAAEACWAAVEARMLELEQDVRDDCHAEMETRMELERRRWKGAWVEEADRNDEHLDAKIEILKRGAALEDDGREYDLVRVCEDAEPEAEERVKELECENDDLRRKLERLERESLMKSPVKKQRVLKAKKWEAELSMESP